MLGKRAVRGDRDAVRRSGREPDRDPPELRGERDERAEHLEVGLVDDGDVDRVRDDRAVERGHHLLGDDHARAVLRLVGRGGEVRGDDDLVELEQRARVRLGREDVERRARELPGPDRLGQRLLVDERSARRVDEPRAVAHQGDCVPIDEAACLVRQRRVERHDVGRCEQLVERLHLLDAEVAEPVAPDEGVEGDDVHRKPERAPCDLLPDPAEPDDAERLPGELDPAVARPLPAALLERGVRLGDVAGERDDQADRLLRRGDDRRLGRVRDDDATPCRRLHVDVVDPDAGPSDHLQAGSPLDDLARQLRRRADHDRVVAVDDLLERRLGVDVDLEAVAEKLDAGLGDRLADEDAHQREGATEPKASNAAGAARPGSTSAPAAASSTSTAASASARSSIVTYPIWPMRNRRETRSPWPPGDRDPVPVAQREPELDRVDALRRQGAR